MIYLMYIAWYQVLISKRAIFQIHKVTRSTIYPVKEGFDIYWIWSLAKDILDTCKIICIHSTCNPFQVIFCCSFVTKRFLCIEAKPLQYSSSYNDIMKYTTVGYERVLHIFIFYDMICFRMLRSVCSLCYICFLATAASSVQLPFD